MADRVKPETLYKYRGFSDLTLGKLVEGTVFYAVPTTFNDQLDTNGNRVRSEIHPNTANKRTGARDRSRPFIGTSRSPKNTHSIVDQ